MRRSLVALALALVLPLPVLAGQVTVKEGETLSEIADRYGLSVNQLMKLNGLNNADHVETGQTISVPGGSAGRSGSRGSGVRASGRVTVQDGDTLSEIADRHGMSLNQLMKLNGLNQADHVETGQTLLVNSPSKSAASGSGFRKGASEHVVRSGESLSAIADGYGIGINKLIAINGISDPDHVEAGTRLKLKSNPPVIKPASPKAAARKPATAQPVIQPVAARPVPPRPRPAANVAKPVQTAAVSTPTPVVSTPARVASTPTPVVPSPATVASTPAPVVSMPATVASTTTPVASTQAPVVSMPARVVSTPATVASTPVPVASTPTPMVSTPARAAAVTGVRSQPSPETKPSTITPTTPRSTAFNINTRPTTTTTARVEGVQPMDNTLIATASTTSRTAISGRQAVDPSATNVITRPIRAAVTRPTVTSRPVATVATATRPATAGMPAASGKPDWRTYGPLQVDWTGWQPMGGSMVAPTLNAQGQSLYLAINCGARKLNATTQAGDWKTWDDPKSDFELQLVNDYCRRRG